MHDEKTETEAEKREKQRQRISLFVDTLSSVNWKGLHQDYQQTSACLLVILYTSQSNNNSLKSTKSVMT